MAQTLRPDADISKSNLDTLHDHGDYTQINDESDSTYITKSTNDPAYLICGLPVPPATPGAGDVTVYFRIIIGDKFTCDVECEIFQGTTSKGSLEKASTTSWVTWSFTATITDYSDLRLKILFTGKQGTYCSEVWVEVPDGAVASAGLEMGVCF